MEDKNGKNGKSSQSGAAVAEQTKNLAKSETAVNGNGKLQETEEGAKVAFQTLNVEDTIKKVNSLNQLIEDRTSLLSHQARVEALKFGEFEDKDFLTLNGKSGAYVIKSVALCKKIAELTKNEIAEHLREVEAKINFNL